MNIIYIHLTTSIGFFSFLLSNCHHLNGFLRGQCPNKGFTVFKSIENNRISTKWLSRRKIRVVLGFCSVPMYLYTFVSFHAVPARQSTISSRVIDDCQLNKIYIRSFGLFLLRCAILVCLAFSHSHFTIFFWLLPNSLSYSLTLFRFYFSLYLYHIFSHWICDFAVCDFLVLGASVGSCNLLLSLLPLFNCMSLRYYFSIRSLLVFSLQSSSCRFGLVFRFHFTNNITQYIHL